MGCIDWTGCLKNGYAWGSRGGKPRTIHRWTYEQEHGPIPEGMVVMHLCDRPSCINPEHLTLGTQSDNMRMSYEHGRSTARGCSNKPGESNPNATLTEAQVRAIRASSATRAELALEHGVSKATIGSVLRGDRWKAVV
ncbi:MAG TPA: HNH endonuclease [Nitrospiraceae bacterium]|nr:HNH endonuclease [Nitrospiraceae bacterium]